MFKFISSHSRLTALAAMAGGAAWVAAGAIQLTGKDELRTEAVETVLDHVMLGMFSAALVLTAPAVIALAKHAKAKRSAYVAAIGMVVLAIAATTSNIKGEDPTFFLVAAPITNAMWLFGSIGLAVSLKRAGEVSKLVAFGLPAVQIFCLPLALVGGGIIGGAYWIAVGYMLSVDGVVKPRAAVAAA